MVAIIKVFQDIGGADTTPGSNIDTSVSNPNLRFKTIDNNVIDSANPIPIPGSGTKYSYWKNLYLKCTQAPSVSVDNFRMYADGAGFGTDITLNIADQYPTRANGDTSGYEVATGTPNDTGDEMVVSHAALSSSTDFFTYTSSVPLTILNSAFISEGGNILDAVNETTHYFLLQVSVGENATPGPKTAETITILYDEV